MVIYLVSTGSGRMYRIHGLFDSAETAEACRAVVMDEFGEANGHTEEFVLNERIW